jgi:hypothetical protein
MSEYSSILRDLEIHERQAALRASARRAQSGATSDRERRWSFRKVTRHSS